MIAGLEKWRDARAGRSVITKRVGEACVCTCSDAGASVVVGRGEDVDAAELDAASQLWRIALEAAGKPSDPPAQYVKRAEPRRAPKKRR